jgi:hypothetical protein
MRIRQKIQNAIARADRFRYAWMECCKLADDYLRNKKSPLTTTGLILFSVKNEERAKYAV